MAHTRHKGIKLLLFFFCFFFIGCAYAQEKESDRAPAKALIKRILPKHHHRFKIEWIEKGEDRFEIESVGEYIVLRAQNGVGIASALHYYLKNFCDVDLSWDAPMPDLPDFLPQIEEKIAQSSPYKFRYYLNYVTYNYSMAWWDWERWEKEIDWMALHGINMPLNIGGQNSIWQRVYRSLGFSDEELDSFFSGPAYSGFNWMGLLDGYGGPLPQSWIDKQEALTKKILSRQRELGMTPVLPAFADKFPKTKINKVQWTVFPEVTLIDPSDSMFVEIGKRFIEEQKAVYGSDHLYTADVFIEVMPPSDDPTYLYNMSQKIYQSMASADAEATWVMQGWMFYFKEDFWKAPQIKALLGAVPDDRMVVLDLWSEMRPVWNRTEAYYGKPWIWCMLHNFGGNNNVFGKMQAIASQPAEALQNPMRGKLSGMGLTMESIHHTPVIYELFLENVWRQKPIDLSKWVEDYVKRRYKAEDENVRKAWHIMQETVYGYRGDINSGGSRSMVYARPGLAKQGPRTDVHSFYDPTDLLAAWQYLIKASDAIEPNDGFNYDLVEVTRQVLANYADELHSRYVSAYEAKNTDLRKKHSARFLNVISDMDRLLATEESFLLGRWLESAKKWGETEKEKALYEWNARNLITLWHGKLGTTLHDYSARQWSGLLEDFYKKRWSMFFDYVEQQAGKNKEPDLEAFVENVREWEWKWMTANNAYPTKTTGNPVEEARRIYDLYYQQILQAYQTRPRTENGNQLEDPAF